MSARIARGARGAIWWLLPVALLLLVSVTPAGATGLEPGVHGDPGSPAGREYAFPLGRARGVAGGGLFGHGITSVRARVPQRRAANTSIAPSTGPQRRAAGAQLPRAGGSRTRPPGQVGSNPPVTANPSRGRERIGRRRAISTAAVSDGSSGAVWMLAAAFCVIAVGGLGGQALARGGRGSSRKAE